MNDKNYYDILGVSMKASLDEITAAKTALAKQYHPDFRRATMDQEEQRAISDQGCQSFSRCKNRS